MLVPLALVCASGVNLVVSDAQLELSVDLPLEGFAHCRVDRSADLQQWEPLSALGLVEGQGTCVCSRRTKPAGRAAILPPGRGRLE